MLINYSDIKDFVVWIDPFSGEITLDAVLKELQNCLKRQKEFENIVYNLLKSYNYNDKDLSSLFNLSQTQLFDMYFKMIKDEL